VSIGGRGGPIASQGFGCISRRFSSENDISHFHFMACEHSFHRFMAWFKNAHFQVTKRTQCALRTSSPEWQVVGARNRF
jgi:hypothetical protein